MGRIVTVPTDGFSHPSFEKRRIKKRYGQYVIDALQPIGHRHDARIYIANIEHNKRIDVGWDEWESKFILLEDINHARGLVFVEMFDSPDIPNCVAERQYFGLLAYDRLPKFVRWVLRKFTGAGRNDVLREVEI